MTDKYLITVKNKSGLSKNFLLFSDLPKLSQNVTDPYVNVWAKSVPVPSPNGHADFDITVEQFAVCGTAPAPLAQGVVVSTGDFTPVTVTSAKPGTKAIMKVDDQGGAAFVPPAGTTDVAHAFGIFVEPYSLSAHPNIFCGFGKRDQNSNVVPVAVWSATPNATFTVVPTITFYVGTGKTSQGTSYKLSEIGDVCTIDFEKAPAPNFTVATIELEDTGEWTGPKFSVPTFKEVPVEVTY